MKEEHLLLLSGIWKFINQVVLIDYIIIIQGGYAMSSTIIKPSAAIRQNYNDISNLAKETHSPIFLTKNGEGDLVVMDIETYDQREKQLELREKLVEIEERRQAGIKDTPARDFLSELREIYTK